MKQVRASEGLGEEQRKPKVSRGKVENTERTEYENNQDVPFHPLIILEGTVNKCPAEILKDSGAATNIMSRAFWKRNRRQFLRHGIRINHSQSELCEESNMIVEKALI